MKKNILIIFLISISLVSCTTENVILQDTNTQTKEKNIEARKNKIEVRKEEAISSLLKDATKETRDLLLDFNEIKKSRDNKKISEKLLEINKVQESMNLKLVEYEKSWDTVNAELIKKDLMIFEEMLR